MAANQTDANDANGLAHLAEVGFFDAMQGINATLVDHPEVTKFVSPSGMAEFDVLVLYDMPGFDFRSGSPPPAFLEPNECLVSGFRGLLEKGVGIVDLHHALAA